MEKAVGYIRVSTEDQAKTGVSLDEQRAKLIGYTQLHEMELVEIVADEGVSAKTLDRPGLGRALGMLAAREADGLLIAKLDRLSRSVVDWGRLIDDYFSERRGKKLWSVADHIDTSSAAGRMVLNMMMTVAQWEREKIAETVKGALQHKILTGSKCSPKVRYGHAIDPADPRRSKKLQLPVGLVVAAHEAEAIDLMKRLQGHGQSLRAIAAELTARGIPTREGSGKWDHSTVRKILKRAR